MGIARRAAADPTQHPWRLCTPCNYSPAVACHCTAPSEHCLHHNPFIISRTASMASRKAVHVPPWQRHHSMLQHLQLQRSAPILPECTHYTREPTHGKQNACREQPQPRAAHSTPFRRASTAGGAKNMCHPQMGMLLLSAYSYCMGSCRQKQYGLVSCCQYSLSNCLVTFPPTRTQQPEPAPRRTRRAAPMPPKTSGDPFPTMNLGALHTLFRTVPAQQVAQLLHPRRLPSTGSAAAPHSLYSQQACASR